MQYTAGTRRTWLVSLWTCHLECQREDMWIKMKLIEMSRELWDKP